MRLPTPFVKLPLRFDAARLRAEIEQFGEQEWRPHPQGYEGNSALILVSRDGQDNDDTVGAMASTARLERCHYIRQVMASLQTVIGRSRLMRLAPGAEVQPHADLGYYWHDHVRIHVPVLTEPTVRFHCGEAQVHMGAGEGWIFDNWRPHRVVNASPNTRIHLVIDTVGSAAFWRLVGQGAALTNGTMRAQQVDTMTFNPNAEVRLPIERVNSEPVASPATVKSLVQELVNELRACRPRYQQHANLETIIIDFARDWQALWALHGTNPDGWEQFRLLLQNMLGPALQQSRNIRLPSNGAAANEVVHNFLDAMLTLPGPQVTEPPATNTCPAPRFERPLIILAAPRSGSTLLYEMLARHPELWTIGGESHGEIENIPGLAPAARQYQSNALDDSDADSETQQRLIEIVIRQLRDNQNRSYIVYPADARPETIRFLEKTPKNALRIPFLQTIFPDALFLFLYREPRANLSSMIEAWNSGRFVTYRDLPEWSGPPWSMLLPPGWQKLQGQTVAEVAAYQWEAANRAIMCSLGALPESRWRALDYATLLEQPDRVLGAVCAFAGLDRNSSLEESIRGGLPLSRYTLTPPDANKWKRHAGELEGVIAHSESLYSTLKSLSNLL